MISGANPALQHTPGSGRGLLSFIPAAETDRIKEEEAKRAAEETQNDEFVSNLGADLALRWQAAKKAKEPIDRILLQCLRQRKGEYDPQKLAMIKTQGLAENFIKITDIKCRAAESWVRDILRPPGEKPWSTDATPIPDLPPEIEQEITMRAYQEYRNALMLYPPQEVDALDWEDLIDEIKHATVQKIKDEAKSAAENLEREIDDDLIEGKWYDAVDDIIYDVVTFPAAFVEGPIKRKEKVLDWVSLPGGGSIPAPTEKVVKMYDRISPFDMYPSPGAKSLQDGYYFIKNRFRRSDLNAMVGVDGYDEESVRYVLKTYGQSGFRMDHAGDHERADVEGRPHEKDDPEGTIDCLKYCGPVQGSKLIEWGMSKAEIPDPDLDYEIKAYMVASTVISAVLNPHPLGKRNIFSASFVKKNDSVWGEGVPQIMSDIQDICNGCVRAMVNNMGMASGPQVWYLADLVDPTMPMTTMHPWKQWPFKSDEMIGKSSPPMGFFQPDPIIDVLIKLYDYFFKQASEITGIPAYIYGSENVKGAGKTASGLSMLMNAASKGLKMVVGHIDNGIVKPSIEAHWLTIMLDDPEKAQGDIKIVARASEYLIMMEQLQIRRMEYLDATNNPVDMQIFGLDGRAEIHRETLHSLKMNTDKILPDRESIMARQEEMKLRKMLEAISASTGIPVEQLVQMASGGTAGPGQGPVGQEKRAIGPDGQPVAGQDFRGMQ